MNLASVLAAIAPFLKQELGVFEPAALAELNALVASVSSPDLKALLQDLSGALDSFAKQEIAKLP